MFMDDTCSVMFTALAFCFYCLAAVLGAPSLYPGNSAVPPSALKVHSSIVCEGQKAYVSCSSIFDQIEVVETMYGRKDKTTCVHPSIPSDTECQEQGTEVQAHIKGMCEGEYSCEVAANNNFMAKAGTVICPDVYKYLQIKYRCVPRTSYPNSNVASNELGQAVSEVITGGSVEAGSPASSSSSSSVLVSSSPLSASVPLITVHEHSHVEPMTTATSQGSVTQIDLHKGMTAGSDITEEFSQAGDNTDVVTETFPSTSMTNAAEVSETFKKSSTPEQPQESGDDGVSNEASASGILDDFEGQRDVVFDERR